jgi:hypothetical protein
VSRLDQLRQALSSTEQRPENEQALVYKPVRLANNELLKALPTGWRENANKYWEIELLTSQEAQTALLVKYNWSATQFAVDSIFVFARSY